MTIQRYFAYIVVALALALAILAAMIWLALRPDKQHRQLKPVQKAMKSGVSGAFKPCVK